MKSTRQAARKQITGYHFTGDKLRNGDPIPKIGEWLKHRGKIEVCASGLHASEHPFDALQYAPGNLLHKVILRGDLEPHGDAVDKWVGRERKILASINAEPLLRSYARQQALKVIHLWEAPVIVKQYLETGDQSLRAAAWAAAWDPAWDTARAAAWDAAQAAAWVAARAAAWDAAWAAARDAAWDTARAAARNNFSKLVEEAFQ